MKVLVKFSARHIRKRKLRALLTLVSVIIGVAAVVSISIATTTTRRSYYEMFSTITGRTALEVIAKGGGTFSQDILAKIDQMPGVRAASPTLKRPTIMHFGEHRIKLFAMGVDLDRDRAIRDYTISEGREFRPREAALIMEADFARSLKLQLDDKVRLLTNRGLEEATVVGFSASQGAESVRRAGLVFLPLQRLQTWAKQPGYIDSIQIVLDEGVDEKEAEARIQAELPEDLACRRPVARSQVMDETLLSTEHGMRMTTMFSLVLAAIIILNTFLMNVGERRPQLAVMRTVGATSRQLSNMIVGESLVMGLVGTGLGMLVGLGGAKLLSLGMSGVLQIAPAPLKITLMPFVLAALFGVGISVLGALFPAWQARQLSPVEGMRPVISGTSESGGYSGYTILGIVMVLTSTAALYCVTRGWLAVEVAVFAAVWLMLGTVLLVPEFLAPLSQIMGWLLRPFWRVESRLAHRQVLRHRTRSTLTVGVILLASSAGVGIANAIFDSVHDVRSWYERTLIGDFFVRAMMPDMTGGTAADIPEAFDDAIRKVPGITRLDTGKFWAVDAAGMHVNVIVRDFKPDQPLALDLEGADRSRVRDELFKGGVIVGTVLAQKAKLEAGGTIPMETVRGLQQVPIAALTNDYLAGGLVIYMEREVAKQLLDVKGVDSYIVKADPAALDQVQQQLQKICEEHGVVLHSFADIAKLIDGMIAGIDAGLWGIIVLSFLVAAIGVFNTLMMNVLEQTRELGLLRIVAMTRRQVRATILTQAAIMGGIGLVPGTLLSLFVAYLFHLSMLPVLGHPVAFIIRPGLMLGSFAAGMAIVLIAAWLPAERAARLLLSKALHYE